MDVQQVVGAAVIPEPYEVWANGVYSRGSKALPAQADIHEYLPRELQQHRKRLTFRPLWVSGLGHTIDTDEPLVQLSYIDLAGNVQSVWLGRGQLTDHAKLLNLGALGLPVDSLSAKGVLRYLVALEHANSNVMPLLKVGHRTGPYFIDNKLGWLIGRRWIGAGELQADPRLNQRYTAAFTPHGDADLWLQKWRQVRDVSWVNRFVMGATFAPPLLRLLKCRTFILHHWGDSGAGKTAMAMFALSAWGSTDVLYSSLNRTAISLTEIFRHLTDVPVLYDEKQVSTVSSEELIYSVCTGAGRERGSKEGGLRQDRPSWLTVARTTGEVPLITNSDVGGQFNRVLQIHSKSFDSKREAETIYPFVTEHYGHAGPMFLDHLFQLLELPNGLNGLQRLNAEMREALVNRVGVDSNHAAYAALIAVAQTLSESWLLGIDSVEARERALDDATLALQETAPKKQLTYAERALNRLRDHWVTNSRDYVDDTSNEGREKSDRVYHLTGVEMAKGLAYIPHEANQLLLKDGLVPERVWRDMHNNGWLVTDGDDTPYLSQSLHKGKIDHKVYCIRREVFFTDGVRSRLTVINGGAHIIGLESL